MTRTKIVAALLVISGVLVLYHDVLTKLVIAWHTDDNYSHGFFIVPIAVYLAWERRARLAATTIKPSSFGLLFVLGSIVLLASGVLGSELFLTRISFLGMLVGIVLFLYGWGYLRDLLRSTIP